MVRPHPTRLSALGAATARVRAVWRASAHTAASLRAGDRVYFKTGATTGEKLKTGHVVEVLSEPRYTIRDEHGHADAARVLGELD